MRSRSAGRGAALAAVMLAVFAGVVPMAYACSCALGDMRTAIDAADGAFVGTLTKRPDPPRGPGPFNSAEEVVWTFSVEKAVKGKLGKEIDVRSALEGASCGFELTEGQRAGILVSRQGEAWSGGLCSQFSPAQLLTAVGPLPKPDGRGPPALLLGVQWGPARAVALDVDGKTIAYGEKAAFATELDVCPGARAVAGVGGGTLMVRSLPGLKLERTVALPASEESMPKAVACHDRDARRVTVVDSIPMEPRAKGRILEVDGERTRVAHEGDWTDAVIRGRHVYLAGGLFGHDIERVDLDAGERTTIARIGSAERPSEQVSSPALSPDGRLLAVVGVPYGLAARIVLIDVDAKRVLGSASLERSAFGEVLWASDTRLVFAPRGDESNVAHVYDRSLQEVGSWSGWASLSAAIRGDTLYGVARGRLIAARLPDGPVGELRQLDTQETHALVALPGKGTPTFPAPRTPPQSPPATPAGRGTILASWAVLLALVVGSIARARAGAR